MISGAFIRFALRAGLMLAFCASWSCSNTKDTWVNRRFHHLSSHYNGYYNAGVKLEDALEKLAASHVDHYDRTLSVFQYADATKAKAIYPQLEDAMKRTSTVIQRHTILDKRGNEKPNSEKWIDDNWILYGKAQFFKHDYFEALETFKYVEATYKKELGRHIASMWIAKTHLELTQLRDAEEKLDYLRNQGDFPKKVKWELEAVNADYYLQTRNPDKAIEHLTRAVALVKKRETKIRFMFILAQLHQQKNNFKLAFDLYTKIIKMNPKYEMAFNARLNRARCYDSSSGSSESVLKELLKMEKDPKNKDFLDQIYFALAGLSKNEGKQEQEIDYLNKSVQSSTTNQNQKAISYLELAKIFYSKPDYRKAQGYYDSTITNLSNDYPDYTEILTRRNSLTKLVKYMKTIETEDSLQSLAKMSPADREKVVDDFLEKEEEEKQRLKEEEAKEQANQIFDPSARQKANEFNNASGSNWYFYNAQALGFGFNDFQKKWGERKLEDDWRRSKKQTSGSSGENIVEIDSSDLIDSDTANVANAANRRESMLKAIPANDTMLAKSTNKIIDAYYNIGMIYREQLGDLKASAESFEELLQKYPRNKYELQCYYQLYRTYTTLGNTSKAEYYKNIILTDFADSEPAHIIRDPDYVNKLMNRKSNLEIFYEETYRKYLNAEYASVITRKSESDLQFPQSHLAPKFDLLKTLSIGRTQPLPVFEASLNDIVRNYSSDSVKDVAQDILDYIHNTNIIQPTPVDTLSTIPKDSTAKDLNLKTYLYFPDTMHYAILIFQNIGGPLNPDKLKNRVSDFNTNNFGTKNLSLQEMLFDHRNKIFIMKSFTDKQDALQYSNLLFDNDEVFGNIDPDAYKLFVVSVNNLPTLLSLKKTDEYEDFFRSFYK